VSERKKVLFGLLPHSFCSTEARFVACETKSQPAFAFDNAWQIINAGRVLTDPITVKICGPGLSRSTRPPIEINTIRAAKAVKQTPLVPLRAIGTR
jgi:hypothetical protein